MNNEEPLAHSAKPDKGIPAQAYAKHIAEVLKRSSNNASVMAQYFSGDAHVLQELVKRAALLHDLGKLDAANQSVLKQGSKRHLPLNHVDAGTSYLSQNKEYEAAFFVYGHHIGLCSVPRETARERLFLRDETICKEVDQKLKDYLAAHEVCCKKIDKSSVVVVKSCWTGLTRRLAFSCLVDGDYGDTAVHYGGETGKQSVSQRWKERLEKLNEYIRKVARREITS